MLLNRVADRSAGYLKGLASSHACAHHPLFDRLQEPVSPQAAIALLINYDAHASLLRRLLLKAAAYMPEAAVGYILENVRNEYGNGDYSMCHQGQLRDVIERVRTFNDLSVEIHAPLTAGVRKYICKVVDYYHPKDKRGLYGPAITAGAVTATELMAIEEFKAMQVAFRRFELDFHPWFDHVNVECDHGEESLALAEFFIDKYDAREAVEFGFNRTLDTNVDLYDGLLESVSEES